MAPAVDRDSPVAMEQARRRLLGPQKRLLERAAFCIRDAIDRTARIHPVESRWARCAYRVRIGPFGSLLPWLAIWGMVLLTFFETPTWCLREPDACHPGTELSDLYPRVTPRFLPRAWSTGLEFAALLVLLGDYCLQVLAEGRPFIICHPWRRGFWHQLLIGAAFLSLLLSACFPTSITFRGGPFLRLFFLVIYSPRLRQEIQLTLRILPPFGKALVLLLAVFLLYAVLGLSLFSPYSDDPADAQEAHLYFKDFKTAFNSVWQLFLYWLYPSIMVLRDPDSPRDFLNPNWIQCIFVFSFMLITIYLLLNLGLAIVCDVYTERNEALEARREGDRKASLEQAYALLLQAAATATEPQPPPPLEKAVVPTYLVEKVLQMVGTFASSAPRLTRRGIAAVIEDLDPELDGFVSQKAFMALPGLVFSSHERHNHSDPDTSPRRRPGQQRAPPPGEEEEKVGEPAQQQQLLMQQQRGYAHRRLRFVDLWCPRVARSGGFQRFELLVKGPYLEWFIDAVIVANVALALAAHGDKSGQAGSEQKPGKALLSQQDFTYVAALIFTGECAAKLLVLGWRRYVASYMNVFDAVLTLLSVLGAIYELGGWSTSGARHHALLVFELLRVLRLFRALLSIPMFRTTAATFVTILPSASALLLNLFALTFAFAALGLEAYGGLVNKDPGQPQAAQLRDTYYFINGLYIFNFNDIAGCFIVLVEILIDASLIQPFSDALGAVKPKRKPWIALFFVLYYVLGQLIVLNIVVAFILDAFMDAQAAEAGKAKDGEAEAEAEAAAASNDGVGGRETTAETLPLLGGLGDGGEDEEEGDDRRQQEQELQRRVLPVAPEGVA